MKQSTRLLVVVILSLIWALTTLFAVASDRMIMTDVFNIFMVLVPFVTFFVTLAVYHLEFKEEYNKENNIK